MLNAIPVVGWFLCLFFSVSLAIPFWIVWTACGVGASYGYFLPSVYHSPGFWDCVGIFIAVSIIKAVFVPKFVSTSSSADTKSK